METIKECQKCGESYNLDNYSKKSGERWIMEEDNVCFSCAWWIKRAGMQNNSQSVITNIDNIFTAYWLGDEDASNHFRGCDGRLFTIKFANGKIVKTTNLWCNGEIPKYIEDMFTVNAEFITGDIEN